MRYLAFANWHSHRPIQCFPDPSDVPLSGASESSSIAIVFVLAKETVELLMSVSCVFVNISALI